MNFIMISRTLSHDYIKCRLSDYPLVFSFRRKNIQISRTSNLDDVFLIFSSIEQCSLIFNFRYLYNPSCFWYKRVWYAACFDRLLFLSFSRPIHAYPRPQRGDSLTRRTERALVASIRDCPTALGWKGCSGTFERCLRKVLLRACVYTVAIPVRRRDTH